VSTAPLTQGRVRAPAARKKLSFLDRGLTLSIFLAMAIRRVGFSGRPASCAPANGGAEALCRRLSPSIKVLEKIRRHDTHSPSGPLLCSNGGCTITA
jgi:hypothetical protein